ncbi:hypothetical protein [Lichenibacterium ramalinae]|uniref:3',5'-cyclic-nucleotide phosphodiesterase n=1 Tax=Lichenibacterium ramalinae TaxID=2316527 RepID=A0A4Q2RDT4_9HYPH|nr:hypothetical protein [Lichenibacterium ramalinae]RYB05612.1 hypothetical protein D3272_08355 [Lichenibacterium ramalinae]
MMSRLIVGLLLTMACVDTASARMVSDKERMRQQAEHLCYNDVQKLCNAEIPDEARIEACMGAHRAQLSPGCRKVFDAGIK